MSDPAPAALVHAVETLEARLLAVGEQLAGELRRLTEAVELVAQIGALDENRPEAWRTLTRWREGRKDSPGGGAR